MVGYIRSHRISRKRDKAIFAALDKQLPRKDGKYRGWSVSHDYPPIPDRSMDWSATHPDFDAEWEGEERGWVGDGRGVTAATYPELTDEIDAWIEENGE